MGLTVYGLSHWKLPGWLGFIIVIINTMVVNYIYNLFFDREVHYWERHLHAKCRAYGKIAALDGDGITRDEENYLFAQYRHMFQYDENNSFRDELANALREGVEYKGNPKRLFAEYPRAFFLDEKIDDMDAALDAFADLCFFAMARGCGEISEKKLSALYYIGRKFNLPRKFVEQVIQNVKEQYSHRNVGEWDPSADAGSDAQDDTFDSDDMTLEECYDILDCKPGDSRIAVKQAYRLKCKCNHPDKVKAFGGTEKDVLLATERIKVINKAYARIKDFRCWT